MDPLSKGTLVVATSFFDMKFKYHMVYHFLFKRARGAHIMHYLPYVQWAIPFYKHTPPIEEY